MADERVLVSYFFLSISNRVLRWWGGISNISPNSFGCLAYHPEKLGNIRPGLSYILRNPVNKGKGTKNMATHVFSTRVLLFSCNSHRNIFHKYVWVYPYMDYIYGRQSLYQTIPRPVKSRLTHRDAYTDPNHLPVYTPHTPPSPPPWRAIFKSLIKKPDSLDFIKF